MTIKIYLDQKDYINIANGILGDTRFNDEVQSYDYLLSLVKQDKVKVYFSWAHITETLNYANVITDSFRKQCEIVDELTQGNCFIESTKIIIQEVKEYLCNEFCKESQGEQNDYTSAIEKENYYTEYNNDYKELREMLPARMKEQLKKKIQSASEDELNKWFSNRSTMTQDDLINLLTFQDDAIKKYFAGTASFKTLILKYRDWWSLYGNINQRPNSRGKQFVEFMEPHRELMILGFEMISDQRTNSGKQKMKHELKKRYDKITDEMLEYISIYYKREIPKYIEEYLRRKGINKLDAIKKLNDFNNILGVRFYKELIREYLKANSGFTNKPRKLDINDYLDTEHLRYLPYVDYFVTEVYFGGIARKIAPKYNAKVFNNLTELRSYLETSI